MYPNLSNIRMDHERNHDTNAITDMMNHGELEILNHMIDRSTALIVQYTEPVIMAYLTGCESNKYEIQINDIAKKHSSIFKSCVPLSVYGTLSDIEKAYLILGQNDFFNDIPLTTVLDNDVPRLPIMTKMLNFEKHFEQKIYLEKNYKYLYRYVAPTNRILVEYKNQDQSSTIYVPPLMDHVTWLNDPSDYSIWAIEKKPLSSSFLYNNKTFIYHYSSELHKTGLIFNPQEYDIINTILKSTNYWQLIAYFREMTSRKQPILSIPAFYQSAVSSN